MRDEVFRIPAVPPRKDAARWVELDGESWYLLNDVLTARHHSAQLAKNAELLGSLPDGSAEQVWVLEPGLTNPGARWVVSEEGRAAVHDWLRDRPVSRRRRRSGKATPPPGRVPGATAQRD